MYFDVIFLRSIHWRVLQMIVNHFKTNVVNSRIYRKNSFNSSARLSKLKANPHRYLIGTFSQLWPIWSNLTWFTMKPDSNRWIWLVLSQKTFRNRQESIRLPKIQNHRVEPVLEINIPGQNEIPVSFCFKRETNQIEIICFRTCSALLASLEYGFHRNLWVWRPVLKMLKIAKIIILSIFLNDDF